MRVATGERSAEAESDPEPLTSQTLVDARDYAEEVKNLLGLAIEGRDCAFEMNHSPYSCGQWQTMLAKTKADLCAALYERTIDAQAAELIAATAERCEARPIVVRASRLCGLKRHNHRSSSLRPLWREGTHD